LGFEFNDSAEALVVDVYPIMCEVYHEAIIDRQNAVILPGKTAGCIALLSGIGPSPESKNENRSLLPEKRPIPESKNENSTLLPERIFCRIIYEKSNLLTFNKIGKLSHTIRGVA